MNVLNFGLKKVFIAKNHHELLEAWELYQGSNLLTFDYHTDTRKAFSTFALESCESDFNYDISIKTRKEQIEEYHKEYNIEKMISRLSYDEQIDFAIEAGIVNKAFIICKEQANSHGQNEKVFRIGSNGILNEDKKIFEISPVCSSQTSFSNHVCNDDCIKMIADQSLENELISYCLYKFKDHGFTKERFILDLDCDYFTTKKSLSPNRMQEFKELINRADAITIALEAACVKGLRLDKKINSKYVKNALLEIIKASL